MRRDTLVSAVDTSIEGQVERTFELIAYDVENLILVIQGDRTGLRGKTAVQQVCWLFANQRGDKRCRRRNWQKGKYWWRTIAGAAAIDKFSESVREATEANEV